MSQVVDSRQQELSTDEIVKIAAENTHAQMPPMKVYMMFVAELGLPNTKLYKIGNTLFVVHPSEQQSEYGVFRALNADTAQNYVQNGKVFVDKAFDDGFKGLQTQFTDPTILNVFNMIAREERAANNPNMGYTVGRTQDGGFNVNLVLHGKRMGS